MATLKNLVDETTKIKNELKTCHTNLKNNLSAKGISVLSTDKMSSLVSKVKDIELGKKWASGSCEDILNKNLNNSQVVTVNTDLNFKPSMVVVCLNEVYCTYSTSVKYKGNIVSTFNTGVDNKITIPTYTPLKAYFNISSNSSFSFTLQGANTHTFYIKSIKWYAFE